MKLNEADIASRRRRIAADQEYAARTLVAAAEKRREADAAYEFARAEAARVPARYTREGLRELRKAAQELAKVAGELTVKGEDALAAVQTARELLALALTAQAAPGTPERTPLSVPGKDYVHVGPSRSEAK